MNSALSKKLDAEVFIQVGITHAYIKVSGLLPKIITKKGYSAEFFINRRTQEIQTARIDTKQGAILQRLKEELINFIEQNPL